MPVTKLEISSCELATNNTKFNVLGKISALLVVELRRFWREFAEDDNIWRMRWRDYKMARTSDHVNVKLIAVGENEKRSNCTYEQKFDVIST